MSAEKLTNIPMKAVEYAAGTVAGKELSRGVSHFLIEKGIDLFEYMGLDEAIEETVPFIESGHKLVILSSHKSHGEIAPAIHVMQEFLKHSHGHLDEFIIPVAASMPGGQQGNIIKTLYEDVLVPITNKRKIHTIPVVTDNDVEKRGMGRSKMKNGLAVYRRLRESENGMFVFIEGSVQGGRKNPETGNIYGLQQPDSLLEDLLTMSKRSMPMVFVPVGISGSHTLFSADGKFFTPEWIKAMGINHFNPNAKFAGVNIGRPIPSSSLDLGNIGQAATNLMIAISGQLPREERGEYVHSDYLLRS